MEALRSRILEISEPTVKRIKVKPRILVEEDV